MMRVTHNKVTVDFDTDPETELTTVNIQTWRQAQVLVKVDSEGNLFVVDVNEGVASGQPVPRGNF